jgi:hypothetical protein
MYSNPRQFTILGYPLSTPIDKVQQAVPFHRQACDAMAFLLLAPPPKERLSFGA